MGVASLYKKKVSWGRKGAWDEDWNSGSEWTGCDGNELDYVFFLSLFPTARSVYAVRVQMWWINTPCDLL